jgi:outer membrane biosynthesis protein TonB
MKALEEINAKELKAVVKELNESGVLPKKIRLVGISIENLVKEFSKAIEELPEDAKVPQMAADFYNDLYEDEIEDDDSDIEESEDDSEDDESDEDESEEDEDDSEGEEDDNDDSDEEDDNDDSDEDDVEDDDSEEDEDESEEEPEPEPVKPEKKESKRKEKPAKEENVKPEKKEKAPKEPKPKKETKPKEEVPINTKVAKEQQAKVKKVWNNLTKKSTLFDLDLAVVKGLLANPKISPKDLYEAVAKDVGEDEEKVKREATKIISAFHYLIGNYPESKEKSKMNRAVQMVLEGENPKFIHSSTVIVIKRMLTAYGATTGLKFKEA